MSILRFAFPCALSAIAISLLADTIVSKDGRAVEGTVLSFSNGIFLVKSDSEKTSSVAAVKVASILFSAAGSDEGGGTSEAAKGNDAAATENPGADSGKLEYVGVMGSVDIEQKLHEIKGKVVKLRFSGRYGIRQKNEDTCEVTLLTQREDNKRLYHKIAVEFPVANRKWFDSLQMFTASNFHGKERFLYGTVHVTTLQNETTGVCTPGPLVKAIGLNQAKDSTTGEFVYTW